MEKINLLLDSKNKHRELTLDEVHEISERMLSSRVSDMTKIKLKCWVYHSESRIKNGNPPFLFDNYAHRLGKQTYLEYIQYNLIDCDDIGGKDKAIEVVQRWFA